MKPKTPRSERKYFGKDVKKFTSVNHQHMIDQIKAKNAGPNEDRFILRRIPNVGT